MPIRYYQEIDDDTGGAPLRREISIATVSDAITLPDNRGAGRTLDKVFVWGGERLERVITWVLSRAGRGPTSALKDIMRSIYHTSTTPRGCAGWSHLMCCGYWGPPSEITKPPTTYELPIVCDWLAYAAHPPRCPKCGAPMAEQDIRTPLKSSKKLVNLMSALNKSSCYISLQSLTLLVTMFPGSRTVFAGIGACDVLHKLSRRMSDQLDMDPLLASSRRALVSLSDAEILSLGKELEALVNGNLWGTTFSLIVSKLIDSFSHPEKMLLALTTVHRYDWHLDSTNYPAVATAYPMLLSRLISSSDPVETAVLTDILYRVIDGHFYFSLSPWFIKLIRTPCQLLEHIPYRLHSLIDGFPARHEQRAIAEEQYFGRRVNSWRRAIWEYDPDDPEGEPANDWRFFKRAARDDGEDAYAKIDAVWWEVPVWETCDRRKRRLEGWEEQLGEDRERLGRDGHRGRRRRAQSMTITAWPSWMKERQEDEAAEWKEYWEKAEFVNFTGWPRKVVVWLDREREPRYRWWRDQDRQIFWTKLSTRMRSHSVES